MNILFITSYPLEYNTSANIRNLGLIEGLINNGHSIYTYSPYPTDDRMFSGNLIDLPFVKRYWIGGKPNKKKQKFNSVISIHDKVKGFLFSLYNYFMIYDRRSVLQRNVSIDDFDKDFDIVISSSDPKSVHLFAEKLFKQKPNFTKKWIQYWGDPFTGDISYKRFIGNLRIKREEHRLISIADKAVFVSPFTADNIKSKYPEISSKISFSPIPYRLSKTPGQYYKFESDNVIIGYMGDYNSSNRNINPLYNALKKSNLQSYIIGNSDIALCPTSNIVIKKRLNGDELHTITEKVNVIVCLCNLGGTQIPGKIYHYVNTGKPIMIIIDGDNALELRQYFESFDRFYICENNEIAILKCLEHIAYERKTFEVPNALNPSKIAEQILL